MEMEFTDANFEAEVLKSEKPVIVDFWATWCGPCQVMGPIIEQLAKEVGEIAKVGKINVDDNGETSQKYGIMSIPAIKIFKGGEIVKEFVGVQSKENLKKALQEIA